MSNFLRNFPFLARFHFPPYNEQVNPDTVGNQIALTHELFRADVKHSMRIYALDFSQAGAGADIAFTIIAEPPSGYCALPILLALNLSGAAGAVLCNVGTMQTASGDLLPQGRWPDAFEMFTLNANIDHWIQIPFRVPIPRGNTLRARWIAPAVGKTVYARSLVAEVPIECVDWSQYFAHGYTRTEAV